MNVAEVRTSINEHNRQYYVGLQTSDILPKSGERFQFKYEYDFNDGWHHQILSEGCIPTSKGIRYPDCVDGERACPKDAVGVGGYEEYFAVIADVNDGRHEEMLRWRRKLDPDEFESGKATKLMHRRFLLRRAASANR